MPGVVLDAEDPAETKADRSPCLGAECILERERSEQRTLHLVFNFRINSFVAMCSDAILWCN